MQLRLGWQAALERQEAPEALRSMQVPLVVGSSMREQNSPWGQGSPVRVQSAPASRLLQVPASQVVLVQPPLASAPWISGSSVEQLSPAYSGVPLVPQRSFTQRTARV
jgi:hypothetical protein